jgi:hypothetical protein
LAFVSLLENGYKIFKNTKNMNMKKHLKIEIQMDEHNAEEEIEIAENVPLLHNAYKIFKYAMNPY